MGGNRLPEEKGQHCTHSLIPETQPQPLGWALAFLCGEESRGCVWGALLLNGGGVSPRGVALAQDHCLWPLTLGFLPILTMCRDLSQMWWVLPGGVRQGTRLYTLGDQLWGTVGVRGGHPPAWGLLGGREGALES